MRTVFVWPVLGVVLGLGCSSNGPVGPVNGPGTPGSVTTVDVNQPWRFHAVWDSSVGNFVFTPLPLIATTTFADPSLPAVQTEIKTESTWSPTDVAGSVPPIGGVALQSSNCTTPFPPPGTDLSCDVTLTWKECTSGCSYTGQYLIYPVVEITAEVGSDGGPTDAFDATNSDGPGNNYLSLAPSPDHGMWNYTNSTEGTGTQAENAPYGDGLQLFLAPSTMSPHNAGTRTWTLANPGGTGDYTILVYAAKSFQSAPQVNIGDPTADYIDACTCTSPTCGSTGSSTAVSGSTTIPFEFLMLGQSLPFAAATKIQFAKKTTGVTFGGLTPTISEPYFTLPSGSLHSPQIFPFWDGATASGGLTFDAAPLTAGRMCYAVGGAQPNRQMVVEWQGMNFAAGPGSNPQSDMDFEVQLNEGTSQINMIYESMVGGAGSNFRETGDEANVAMQGGGIGVNNAGAGAGTVGDEGTAGGPTATSYVQLP